MNNYFLTILIASTIVISSCGGEKPTENTATTCFYEYEKSNTISLKWTAYKTSEKIAVEGTFNNVLVTGGEKSTKLPEVLNAIKFTILTNSTNTTKPERDEKIVNSSEEFVNVYVEDFSIQFIVNDKTGEEVVPYGTGTIPFTQLGYNSEGNYFDLYMNSFVPGFIYKLLFLIDINKVDKKQIDSSFVFKVV